MAASQIQQAAVSLLDFINSSPTPFHAVRTAKEQLSKAGFQEIKVIATTVLLHPMGANGLCRKKYRGYQPVWLAENTI